MGGLAEREIMLLVFRLAGEIRPKDVVIQLGMNHRTAVRYLQSLCKQGWLQRN